MKYVIFIMVCHNTHNPTPTQVGKLRKPGTIIETYLRIYKEL